MLSSHSSSLISQGKMMEKSNSLGKPSKSTSPTNSTSHGGDWNAKLWKDQKAMKRVFPKGAKLLMHGTTKGKNCPEKQGVEWSGSFIVCRVIASGAIEIKDNERKFLVSGQRLRNYWDGCDFSSHTIHLDPE